MNAQTECTHRVSFVCISPATDRITRLSVPRWVCPLASIGVDSTPQQPRLDSLSCGANSSRTTNPRPAHAKVKPRRAVVTFDAAPPFDDTSVASSCSVASAVQVADTHRLLRVPCPAVTDQSCGRLAATTPETTGLLLVPCNRPIPCRPSFNRAEPSDCRGFGSALYLPLITFPLIVAPSESSPAPALSLRPGRRSLLRVFSDPQHRRCRHIRQSGSRPDPIPKLSTHPH